MSGEPESPSQTPPGSPKGADIARAALQAARAGRRKAGGQQSGAQRAVPRRRRGWSGARPDDRDPQPLGALASRLVADRGWADRVSAGVVFARWAQLVGAEVAEHAQPVSLKDGELIVRASSTAWATQLRLLQRQLIARITAGVGPGVVTALRVQGPAAPNWVHGPRHVRGRGPRDTYG
jgi:predicted nucleic acid-binding Zn ribbon protein